MKKYIIALLLFSTFISCESNIEENETNYIYGGSRIIILEIDSCEYLYLNDITSLTHKGNCKYCKNREND